MFGKRTPFVVDCASIIALAFGEAVPIPTLPLASIRIRSVGVAAPDGLVPNRRIPVMSVSEVYVPTDATIFAMLRRLVPPYAAKFMFIT